MDFLAEQHKCGQHILKLVARGNSIIAELLRLKDVIPLVYRNPSKAETQRFGELINLDFNYFKQGNSDFEEKYERKVEANDELASADEELKDTFSSLLKRFYRLFENVYNYVRDLNYFLKDVEDGQFMQMNSLEAIFLDEDGKQLLCESLYVYGVMLLLVDVYIEGPVRERLLVAHYRYSGAEANIADICKLLRSTGYSPNGKRPTNYPESYFSRISIPNRFIRLVIARLRSDDIYNQLRTYQNPDHRCTALSEQAAMLYVVLNFEPAILSNETATMREIVDKFFSNNWVISYYMGTTVNLIEAWEPYKAAKAALANILQTANIKQISQKYLESLKISYPSVTKLQKEGALTEEKVLDHAVKMMNIVQECNVLLKWMMLHTTPLSPGGELNKRCRQFRDLVINEIGYEQGDFVFSLLLNTSQFEFRLRTILKKILDNRETKWNTAKEETRSRLVELSEIYGKSNNDSTNGSSGSSSRRLVKSDHLEKWFIEREKQVEELTLNDIGFSSGVAAQLIEALSEAEDLDQLDASWQVKQLISEARGFLKQMIRVGGAKESLLITLQIIGDISYAWGDIIDNFTPHMQKGVKKDPSLVSKLRATFVKLSSAMERPVLRISQARSNDMVSVAQYYSAELVAYVRKVLQIIPESLFKVLDQIILLQTDKIEELPTRLEKDKLRDLAQLNERFEVARLTHSISVFTEGILSMKSTSVGVIKVDPKKLLEDGIRKEIVRQVSWALHNGLIFNPKAKSSELISKLTQLKKVMSGYQRSFEYISDYVGISGLGLKIWHSELARIFKFIVEQESNPLVKNKVLPSESSYQSRAVPIPLHSVTSTLGGGVNVPGSMGFAITFIGRLANEIVALTNPRNTIFVHARQAWYDSRTSEEVVAISKLFPLLESAIGLNGLTGLDKLYGLRIKSICLQREFLHAADVTIFKDKNWIDMLENMADSLSNGFVIAAPYKFYYQQHISRAAKPLSNLSEAIVNIGHLQLLRKALSYQLSSSSKFDAKLLFSALTTLDKSVASEMKFKLIYPEASSGTPNDGKFLSQLNNYLASSGITQPEKQIYVEAKPGPRLAELIFLIILSTLSKLTYSHNAGGLIAKRPTDMLDGYPFFLGISCLLRQYPTSIMDTVIEYVAQYIRSFVKEQASSNKISELPPDVTNAVVCLEIIMNSHEETREHVQKLLPKPLFDFKSLPTN